MGTDRIIGVKAIKNSIEQGFITRERVARIRTSGLTGEQRWTHIQPKKNK